MTNSDVWFLVRGGCNRRTFMEGRGLLLETVLRKETGRSEWKDRGVLSETQKECKEGRGRVVSGNSVITWRTLVYNIKKSYGSWGLFQKAYLTISEPNPELLSWLTPRWETPHPESTTCMVSTRSYHWFISNDTIHHGLMGLHLNPVEMEILMCAYEWCVSLKTHWSSSSLSWSGGKSQ